MNEWDFKEMFLTSAKKNLEDIKNALQEIREALFHGSDEDVFAAVTITRLLHHYLFEKAPIDAGLLAKKIQLMENGNESG